MAANGNALSDGLFIAGGSEAVFDTSESTTDVFAKGQLGKIAHIRETTVPDPGDGTKVVQYVSRYATDTVAVANGAPAFWQDVDNFVVTGEITNAVGATTNGILAGVFGSSNPAAGSYGFIQVGGLGPMRITTSGSGSTTAQGSVMVWSAQGVFKALVKGTDITTVITELASAPLEIGRLVTGNNSTAALQTATGLIDVVRNGW